MNQLKIGNYFYFYNFHLCNILENLKLPWRSCMFLLYFQITSCCTVESSRCKLSAPEVLDILVSKFLVFWSGKRTRWCCSAAAITTLLTLICLSTQQYYYCDIAVITSLHCQFLAILKLLANISIANLLQQFSFSFKSAC